MVHDWQRVTKLTALGHLPPSRLPPPGQNLPGNSRVPPQLQMSKGAATTMTTMPMTKTRRRIQRKDKEEEEEEEEEELPITRKQSQEKG